MGWIVHFNGKGSQSQLCLMLTPTLAARLQESASAGGAPALHSYGSSGPPTAPASAANLRDSSVLYSWVQHRVGHYLERLAAHLPNITEGGNLASVLEHCLVGGPCWLSTASVHHCLLPAVHCKRVLLVLWLSAAALPAVRAVPGGGRQACMDGLCGQCLRLLVLQPGALSAALRGGYRAVACLWGAASTARLVWQPRCRTALGTAPAAPSPGMH
jgi:hypothetical protein